MTWSPPVDAVRQTIRIVVCNGMKWLESCEFVSSENSSNSIRLRVDGMTPTLSLIELIEA